jgi:hypothetical protein
MSNSEFDDIIAAGFTDRDEVEAPAEWRLKPPPDRVPIPLVSLPRPRSGQPIVFRYSWDEGTVWITDFVLYGHTVETVQLEGLGQPVACIKIAEANGWDAAAHGYAAPIRKCPIDWAYAYVDDTGQNHPTEEHDPPRLPPQPVAHVGTLLGRSIRCQMPYDADQLQEGAWTWWKAVTEVIINPETGDRVVGLTSPDEWAEARYGDPTPGLPQVWYCAVEEAWTY